MQTFDIDDHRKDKHGRAPEWAVARPALRQAAPPDRVEALLLRTIAQRHASKPWYRRWVLDAVSFRAGVAAASCALALACVGLWPPGVSQPASGDRIEAADGFLALAPAEQIAAAVNPQLKRADLTREALAQLGIPIIADAPDELIRAELLVSVAGEPLAIRLAVN